MTMLFVPAMLLIVVLPVLALYTGLGGVLRLFGRRRQRRALRVAGTSLALASGVFAVGLAVGNILWFLLDPKIGSTGDSAVLKWLTPFLFVAAGASLVGPPIVAAIRPLRTRPADGQ